MLLEDVSLLADPSYKNEDGFWETFERAAENGFGVYLSVFGTKNKLVAYEGERRIRLGDVIDWVGQNGGKVPLAINLDYGSNGPEAKLAAEKVISMLKDTGIEYVLFTENTGALASLKMNHPSVETGVVFMSLYDMRMSQESGRIEGLEIKHLSLNSDLDGSKLLLDFKEELAKSDIRLWIGTNTRFAYASFLLKFGASVMSYYPEEVWLPEGK